MTKKYCISPLDDRYYEKIAELSEFFSDFAITRCRLKIEVEYFLALSQERGVQEFPPIPKKIQQKLILLYKNFSNQDYLAIKKIEKKTNHDVKAIEYFLKNTLPKELKPYTEFVHFALTSEDINSVTYALLWQTAVRQVIVPTILLINKKLTEMSRWYSTIPLLSLTHGQSATPTTVGKEMAVFEKRLSRQLINLQNHKLQAKLSGATGTWAAHVVAYPQVNWPKFSKKFIESFGLRANLITTQVEPSDSLAELCQTLALTNSILLDFCRDMWLYISRGIFTQKNKTGEVGSSTMPHKINPIQFENAEGNLGLANALLYHYSEKLPVSRLQRDLSGSTVMRNSGVALGHSLLAYKSILSGLERIEVDVTRAKGELNQHWEVLGEAIQVLLRKNGVNNPYELIKKLTRGKQISAESYQELIQKLKIPDSQKKQLQKLTPETYLGLSEIIAKM